MTFRRFVPFGCWSSFLCRDAREWGHGSTDARDGTYQTEDQKTSRLAIEVFDSLHVQRSSEALWLVGVVSNEAGEGITGL